MSDSIFYPEFPSSFPINMYNSISVLSILIIYQFSIILILVFPNVLMENNKKQGEAEEVEENPKKV